MEVSAQPGTESSSANAAKMGKMQTQLIAVLEAAGEKLRSQSADLAPHNSAPDFGGALSAVVPRVASSEAAVATVITGAAAWLRETDLSHVEDRIMSEIDEHPIRSLGIAAAVGFLVSRR